MNLSQENDYLFTKEAYDAYNELSFELKQSFWKFFDEERFINKGERIMYFMFDIFTWKNNIALETQLNFNGKLLSEIERYYDGQIGSINFEDIFLGNTYVIKQNQKIVTKYDFEYAEYIFSHIERYKNCDNGKQIKPHNKSFGRLWWDMSKKIMGELNK